MSSSRRECLRLLSALVLSGCAQGALGQRRPDPSPAPARPRRSLRILILGGTNFLGPATIEVARARGHGITIFHRGRTRPDLFPDVEKLHGDRDPDKAPGLAALTGRQWDVVIDNSGFYPRMVSASATLLAGSVKHYIYISSISAYKEPNPENGDETAALATLADPTVEDMGKDYQNYGGLKVLCEQAVERALPGRATLIRPGYIVGPDDPSGRFTYWPVRFARGGTVAVPGGPEDPLQIIDVRDLGAWLVHLAEGGTMGTFNACGPQTPLTWGQVINFCQQAGDPKSKIVWLPADFMAGQKEVEFPIWAAHSGETRGFHTWRIDRAVRAGLTFRSVQDTVKDTLAWYRAQEREEKGRIKLAGPTPEQEAMLIASAQGRK